MIFLRSSTVEESYKATTTYNNTGTEGKKYIKIVLSCALSKDSFLQLNRQKANSFPLLPASFLKV
jgi:hypothetical protein